MGANVQGSTGDRELISERVLVEATGNAPAQRNVGAILRDAGEPRPEWRRRCVSASGQISGLHVVLDEQAVGRSVYHRAVTGGGERSGRDLRRKSSSRYGESLAGKSGEPLH